MRKNYFISLFISGLLTTQFISIKTNAIASEVVDSSQTKQILAQNMMGEFTQEQVSAIMKEIEEAELNEDAEKIISYLAPFVVSSVTVEKSDTTITTHLEGKQAHQDFIVNNFKITEEKETINSYMTTEVSAGGEVITVNRIRLREIQTVDNREVISSSTDVIRFAMIDNKPMIININVKGWMEERP